MPLWKLEKIQIEYTNLAYKDWNVYKLFQLGYIVSFFGVLYYQISINEFS